MNIFFKYIYLLLFSLLGLAQSTGQSIVDSVKIEDKIDESKVPQKDTSKVFLKTLAKSFGFQAYSPEEKPRIAFVRSLFIPGWGQLTNRDYWKMGVVYAAAGAGYYYGVNLNNKRYKRYLGHYEKATFHGRGLVFYDDTDFSNENQLPLSAQYYVSNDDDHETFYLQTLEEGINYILDKKNGEVNGVMTTYFTVEESPVAEDAIAGAVDINTFESAKNQYRRWRDASILGIAAGWLFFALEANVAGHLKTFDMSENISFKFEPAGPNTFGMHASGIKLALVLD